MSEVTATPDPVVTHPHFVVHQDGRPVVLNASFVSIVADINSAEASRVPIWTQCEIVLAGRVVFCDETLHEVCNKITPMWKQDMAKLERMVVKKLGDDETQGDSGTSA